MKAIIDLGTNTFHLLIADVNGTKITVYEKVQVPVKIGRGGVHKNRLADDAMQRAMNALQEFKTAIGKYENVQVHAFGTAAIRDADNGLDFMQKVFERFGFQIQAISGEQEAEYIYRGVKSALPAMHMPYLIMDIGGGSVEFIIVQNGESVWKHSFRIGASRLIQSFSISDPFTSEEIQALKLHFTDTFKPLSEAMEMYKPRILAGSAGSFETLKEILEKDMYFETVSLTENAFELPFQNTMQCLQMLIHSTRKEREQLKGLATFRMEMIAVAALMTLWVISKSEIKRIITSYYSLKEGALMSV